MKRNNLSSSQSDIEIAFQHAYNVYGWIREGQKLCVAQSRNKTVNLPEGEWAMRNCCKTRSKSCSYTACPENFHISPKEVSWETLLRVHPENHLKMLQTDRNQLYDIFEISPPTTVTESDVTDILESARRDTGGSILAAALAYVHKFCLSFCGGHHHVSTTVSEGSGLFADVPLSWIILRETIQKLGIGKDPKALYIDVDVHHANGFSHCLNEIEGLKDSFFMVDLYNSDIFPLRNRDEIFDDSSIKFLSIAKPFHSKTGTKAYLNLLKKALEEAERDLPVPDIIYYMANNDILKGDKLGNVHVTPNGILERDRMVLNWARKRDIPIVMISGGGYAKNGCKVTRDILLKLNAEFSLWETVPKKQKY